jgi:hypothetical protein
MLETVVPYVRDATWSGWQQVAWAEPPLFDPAPWVPRVGVMIGPPGARRLIGHSDLQSMTMTIDQLLQHAIAHVSQWPPNWQVIAKAGGVLGVGAKPAVLELRDELATERLLDASAIDHAQRMLGHPQIVFVSPMRGIVRAILEPFDGNAAIHAQLTKEKGEAVAAYDANLAANAEAVSAATFAPRGVPLQYIETIAPLGGGRERSYIPRQDRIVPKIEARESQFFWDLIPHHDITHGPAALRLCVGVHGPTRFFHLANDTYTAMRFDFGTMQRVAMANLLPLRPEEIDPQYKIVGFRGQGAPEQLLIPASLFELHRMLNAPSLRVAIPNDRLLVAVAAGASVTDENLASYATRAEQGVAVSSGVHVVENGQLTQSMVPGQRWHG